MRLRLCSGQVKIIEKCLFFLTGNTEQFITISGDNFFIDHSLVYGGLVIKTLEGNMIASIGDYIIKGLRGEFYPCKPDVFEKKYELIK